MEEINKITSSNKLLSFYDNLIVSMRISIFYYFNFEQLSSVFLLLFKFCVDFWTEMRKRLASVFLSFCRCGNKLHEPAIPLGGVGDVPSR